MPTILTMARQHAGALPLEGCWRVPSLDFILPIWHSRAQVENDENLLQPITYLMLRNAAGQVWCYQRTGGDARLQSRYSCGVGGHVDVADAIPAQANAPISLEQTLNQALLRELAEELNGTCNDLQGLRFRALIYEGKTAVGRVHLGLLYSADWIAKAPPQPAPKEALKSLGFMDLSAISSNPKFELWSRLAAQYLQDNPA